MKIEIYPKDEPINDWEAAFGATRKEIVSTITGNGWMNKVGGTHLDVNDLADFSLHFSVTGNPEIKEDYPDNFCMFISFCNYCEGERWISLSDVGSHDDLQQRGMGRPLIAHVARAALLIGAEEICLEASQVGAYMWLRGGAIPNEWPSKMWLETDTKTFAQRFKELLEKPEITPGWSAEQRAWLKAIYTAKNPMGLCEIAARDDLFVLQEGKPVKLGVFLLKDTNLGACTFDFNNPWTVRRLRDYAGFDLKAEKKLLKTRPSGFHAEAAKRVAAL